MIFWHIVTGIGTVGFLLMIVEILIPPQAGWVFQKVNLKKL